MSDVTPPPVPVDALVVPTALADGDIPVEAAAAASEPAPAPEAVAPESTEVIVADTLPEEEPEEEQPEALTPTEVIPAPRSPNSLLAQMLQFPLGQKVNFAGRAWSFLNAEHLDGELKIPGFYLYKRELGVDHLLRVDMEGLFDVRGGALITNDVKKLLQDLAAIS